MQTVDEQVIAIHRRIDGTRYSSVNSPAVTSATPRTIRFVAGRAVMVTTSCPASVVTTTLPQPIWASATRVPNVVNTAATRNRRQPRRRREQWVTRTRRSAARSTRSHSHGVNFYLIARQIVTTGRSMPPAGQPNPAAGLRAPGGIPPPVSLPHRNCLANFRLGPAQGRHITQILDPTGQPETPYRVSGGPAPQRNRPARSHPRRKHLKPAQTTSQPAHPPDAPQKNRRSERRSTPAHHSPTGCATPWAPPRAIRAGRGSVTATGTAPRNVTVPSPWMNRIGKPARMRFQGLEHRGELAAQQLRPALAGTAASGEKRQNCGG
jgi:hypothetical protein